MEARCMGQFFDANLITDDIWVGSRDAAEDIETLQKLKFSAILNVSLDNTLFSYYSPSWKLLHLPLYDGEKIPQQILREAVNFLLLTVQEGRRILLHCAAGVSRSVSIMGAYLMKIKGMTPPLAINFIMERLPEAAPSTYTFNSAIEWVFKKTSFLCRKCNNTWRYTPDFLYRIYENSYSSQISLCNCKNPDLEL